MDTSASMDSMESFDAKGQRRPPRKEPRNSSASTVHRPAVRLRLENAIKHQILGAHRNRDLGAVVRHGV